MNFVQSLLILSFAVPSFTSKLYRVDLNELHSSGVHGSVAIYAVYQLQMVHGSVAIYAVYQWQIYGAGIASGMENVNCSGGDTWSSYDACRIEIHNGTSCAALPKQSEVGPIQEPPQNQSYENFLNGSRSFRSSGGIMSSAWNLRAWEHVGHHVTNGSNKDMSFSLEPMAVNNLEHGWLQNGWDLAGKLFTMYDKNGEKVACGALEDTETHFVANLLPTVSGVPFIQPPPEMSKPWVALATTARTVFGAGVLSGLQPSLSSFRRGGRNCSATNGCGAHVHSGFSCENTTTQGGHYFTGDVDPWTSIGYLKTDAYGLSFFVFMTQSSATDISGKPFILHDDQGNRIMCGILEQKLVSTTNTPDVALSAAHRASVLLSAFFGLLLYRWIL